MDSELRDVIKKIGEYNNMDRCEFYYYDETNNSRMFRLKNDSFNVNPFQKFSLGGLVSKKDIINNNHNELWNKLKINSNIPELKSKYIFKKSDDFLESIDTKNIELILEYIKSKGYNLHFNYLNLLWLTIVDIVDNSYDNSKNNSIKRYNPQLLKQELYLKVKNDIPWLEKLFKKYNFPNLVEQKELNDFYTEFAEYLSKQSNQNEYTKVLIDLFTNTVIKDNLFRGEESHIYIKDFSALYTINSKILIHSKHSFDEEMHIKEKIKFFSNSNIHWYKSHEHRTIQLCDCVIAIINRFINFIENNSYTNLKEQLVYAFDVAESPRLRRNLTLLGFLLNKSYLHEPLNRRLTTIDETAIKYEEFVSKLSSLSKLSF
ncbi:hypothetical protein [Staphylococcus epidermidis]|uniref:hypothetical protein n=1 Tax=Staphylococcus epidermidis TaxID=1282 RepID=UPI001F257768|nr:hypothetical protein [Staphylococcus epidermidis]MCF7587780.1 hypothetical protein [Staphylococcus epidermidis]